jgi:ParB/RepB/Spo0J family partition protein
VEYRPLTVKALPVADLRPNTYNPNEMTEAGFEELVSEVRHLGRIPKPVVVRAIDDCTNKYVIVDGEHSWRAASEVGLDVVDCEVVEVDDFEAMAQTYKRNQHGSRDPVKLGQMFQKMCSEGLLSGRKLASQLGISEGTVRNAVNYARAAALRSAYAFDSLSQEQIRRYLRIPAPINDLWLDSGAKLSTLHKALSVTLGKDRPNKRGWKPSSQSDEGIEFLEFLTGSGLHETIVATDFVRTTHRAFHLMEWQFGYRIENLKDYVLVVAKLRLPVDVLYQIPLGKTANAENKFPVLVSVEKWEEMLTVCLRTNNEEEQIAIARSAKRVILKELDHDAEDLLDPRVLELQQIVDGAPDFIRSSELELREKAYVADAYIEGVSEEIVLEAKRLTVERWTIRKRILENGQPSELEQFRSILTLSLEQIMDQALREAATNHDRKQKEENKRQQQTAIEELLAKPRDLAEALTTKLADTSLKHWKINNRPALEVLVMRICSLPSAELKLLAAHLVGHSELALKVWFQSMKDEHEVERVN